MDVTIIERHGLRFRVVWQQDTDMGPPWEDHDGYGPVSDWTSRGKYPGELVLQSSRAQKRYYDFAAATRMAKRDGWGLSEPHMLELAEKLGRVPTRNEVVRAAVLRDFEDIRDWCLDRWWWEYVMVTLLDNRAEDTPVFETLGGISSNDTDDYRAEVVEERITELLNGRGDPDKLERITVGATTYELREGGRTLTDKLADALELAMLHVDAETNPETMADIEAVLAEYNVSKGGV